MHPSPNSSTSFDKPEGGGGDECAVTFCSAGVASWSGATRRTKGTVLARAAWGKSGPAGVGAGWSARTADTGAGAGAAAAAAGPIRLRKHPRVTGAHVGKRGVVLAHCQGRAVCDLRSEGRGWEEGGGRAGGWGGLPTVVLARRGW